MATKTSSDSSTSSDNEDNISLGTSLDNYKDNNKLIISTIYSQLKPDIDTLQSRTNNVYKDLSDIKSELKLFKNTDLPEIRKEIKDNTSKSLELLGIFVALFTFVSVEFQLFRSSAQTLIVPLSLIIAGGLIMFLSLLVYVIRFEKVKDVKENRKDNVTRFGIFFFLTASVLILAGGFWSYNESFNKISSCTNNKNELAQRIIDSSDQSQTEILKEKYQTIQCGN